ncbi:hypothetical protein [Streptomyces achromogenes]|uniref:hypothetical protein n=1 Tax=Streptomyces achromogenes TaxID=67255 RepID=UPI00370259C0
MCPRPRSWSIPTRPHAGRSGAPEAEAIVVEHVEQQRSFVADRFREEAWEALRVLRRAGVP